MKNKYGNTDKVEEFYENGQTSYIYVNTEHEKGFASNFKRFGPDFLYEYTYDINGKRITSAGPVYITYYSYFIDIAGNECTQTIQMPHNRV